MMKEEFEKLVGKKVSNTDYEIIEKVYVWHPSITATNGKKQISDIYKKYGMLVVKAMLEAAEIMESIDRQEMILKNKLAELKNRRETVISGDLNFELCRKAVYEAHEDTEDYKEFEKMLEKLGNKFGRDTVVEAKISLGI